jgi:hypothetical protein
MTTLKSEYEFGNKAEIELEKLMLDTFGVIRNQNKYAVYDYESNETLVELKNRRCFSYSFKDIMMNHSKIELAKTTTKDCYFVFKFIDGIYYWKYDPDVELRTDINGRTDRGMNEQKQFHYIPTHLLNRLADSSQ